MPVSLHPTHFAECCIRNQVTISSVPPAPEASSPMVEKLLCGRPPQVGRHWCFLRRISLGSRPLLAYCGAETEPTYFLFHLL